MFWKLPIFAITLSVVFGTAALADNSSQPSDSIIVHTVQCEAGRAGAYLVANGFSANLKVSVSWTSKRTQDSSFGTILKFFHIGGSWDRVDRI